MGLLDLLKKQPFALLELSFYLNQCPHNWFFLGLVLVEINTLLANFNNPKEVMISMYIFQKDLNVIRGPKLHTRFKNIIMATQEQVVIEEF